jgi:surface antigen
MSRRVIRGCGLITLLLMLATGCAGGGGQFGQDVSQNKGLAIGGLGGMTAGGLIAAAAHANPAGIAAGVILGGLTGGLIGHLVDNKDKEIAAKTTHQALESAPSGKAVTWQNPDNGHTGTVTPLHTYQTGTGQYCCEYTQAVTIDNRPQQSYGTACRQPDGSWRIVS